MTTEDKFDPHSIVTEKHVKKVLCQDKGQEAKLVSWKIVDFMKKGENFGSLVTSIEVNYKHDDGRPMDTVYVVKLNPSGDDNPMNQLIFLKEAMFYSSLLPELNGVMVSIGQPMLNYAQYYYSSLEENKEQIYFEDLNKRNFKRHDKQIGFDIKHVNLVMVALAKLHASSLVLQSKDSEPFEVKHSYLLEDFMNQKDLSVPLFANALLGANKMLDKIGGCERAIVWLKSLLPQVFDIITTETKGKICNVVCHGDFWNGNVLFRYNCQNEPVEVVMVDEQQNRIASPASDLNYFIYTSIEPQVRKSHLDHFLLTYYNAFKNIVEKGGINMPFTMEELQVEFASKHKYGALIALYATPIIFLSTCEIQDMDGEDCNWKSLIDKATQSAYNSIDTNYSLKQRFLGLFDEFIEKGFIS